jgi:cytochrome c biogenesis protein
MATTGERAHAAAHEMPGPFDLLWRWLNSLPIAIVVMLLLAALNAIGTIIPQSHLAQPPDGMTFTQFLEQRYGPAQWAALHLGSHVLHLPESRTSLIIALGFHHIYFTAYFFLLMLWLSVSAVVCNITRYKRTVRMWQTPAVKRGASFFTADRRSAELPPQPPGAPQQLAAALAAQRFRVVTDEHQGAAVLYADRGFVKKWALVLLHVAILVLLSGGMISAALGNKGMIQLGDGETKPLVIQRDEHKHPIVKGLLSHLPPLVYTLHQHDFRIDYDKKIFVPTDIQKNVPDALKPYYMYFVRAFVSTLEAEHGSQKVGPQEVIVNQPLRVEKLAIYQSGYTQIGYVRVDYGGGNVKEFPVQSGEWLAVAPGGVMLSDMAAQTGTPVAGEAFSVEQVKAGNLYVDGKESGYIGPMTIAHLADRSTGQGVDDVLLTPDHGFTVMLNGQPVKVTMSKRVDNFSDFSYTRDPGLPVLALGWILLVIGIAGALYVPFTQVQARFEAGRAFVLVTGAGGGADGPVLRRLHAILQDAS